MNEKLIAGIARTPLIAILRGISPNECLQVADTLIDAGFYFLEVTLDSPLWQNSIEKIATHYGDYVLLGAGTAITKQDVSCVHAAGGQAVISPNTSIEVIEHCKSLGMISIPGCLTPSECFAALAAGADILKIFPASSLNVQYIKSLSVVLPNNTRLCPTGGVDITNIRDYLSAGAFSVGIGAALYQPGIKQNKLSEMAHQLVAKARPYYG